MTNSEVESVKRLVDIRIFEVPEEDWLAFREIMAAYGYNKAVAFRAILDAYFVTREIAEIHTKLATFEDRVTWLESVARREIVTEGAKQEQKGGMPKTFGTASEGIKNE